MKKLKLIIFVILFYPMINHAQNKIMINEIIWNSLNSEEKIYAAEFIKDIDIIPGESIGIISSVQIVDRSTGATHGGSLLGSAVAQATYIDKMGNYSARNHLGVAIIGAAVGSTLDKGEEFKYIHSYAIKNLKNNIIQIQVDSGREIHIPVGSCVTYPNIKILDFSACSVSKNEFMQRLHFIENAPKNSSIMPSQSGIKVKCRSKNGSLMTLDKNICSQTGGSIEVN